VSCFRVGRAKDFYGRENVYFGQRIEISEGSKNVVSGVNAFQAGMRFSARRICIYPVVALKL
jgi:hypothetical protein